MIVGGCLVASVVILALWPGEREPEYQGRTLSEWITAYSVISDTNSAAADALRHIGTNALPFLVKWVRYQSPAWRTNLLASYVKLPDPLHNLPGYWLAQDAKENRAWAASAAFGVIGLTPVLALLQERQAAGDFAEAGECSDVILRMHVSGVDITPAVPALLLESDWIARGHTRLKNPVEVFSGEAGPFIEAVTNCMDHTNCIVRQMAAYTLGCIAWDRSVLALDRARSHPDVLVRIQVTNALMKIAPEVLTNGAMR
jgi:HEAT repeat protein